MTATPKILFFISLAPVMGTAQYVGSTACAPCHQAKFDSQSRSGHAHALAPSPQGSPGQWAFGAGAKAITYVSQADPEHYLEHGLSYYSAIKATAMTPGHTNTAGVRYPTFDAEATTLKCFRCHSTGPLSLQTGYRIQPSELGVRCESCHGPGAVHVEAKGVAGSIRNPKRLNAAELNELCGTCHRPPGDNDWTDPWMTRHQPAYLTQSVCFRKSEGELSCLTCHGPHESLDQKAADYDAKCVSCHPSIRHRVPIASKTCVGCHMPQVKVSAQLHFTNHWIGVYASAGQALVPSESPTRHVPPVPVLAKRPEWLDDSSSLQYLFAQALVARETEFGSKDPKVARTASALGLFLMKVGEPIKAEGPLRKALDIDQASGAGAVAADEENLAAVLQQSGKREESFELLQHAARSTDLAVASRSFAKLASVDPEHSEEYYRGALTAEESLGLNSPRVAVLLGDLAVILQGRKDYLGAESLFRRALAIQRQSSGPESPVVASTLSNLGTLLQATGDVTQAEQLERKAMDIFERKLGPFNVELATACSNLADVLWSKKEFASAAAFYRRAISIDETVYGPDNPEVAGDLVNLGLLLRDSGNGSAAMQSLRRALAINEKTFGPNSPQSLQVKRELQIAPR